MRVCAHFDRSFLELTRRRTVSRGDSANGRAFPRAGVPRGRQKSTTVTTKHAHREWLALKIIVHLSCGRRWFFGGLLLPDNLNEGDDLRSRKARGWSRWVWSGWLGNDSLFHGFFIEIHDPLHGDDRLLLGKM